MIGPLNVPVINFFIATVPIYAQISWLELRLEYIY